MPISRTVRAATMTAVVGCLAFSFAGLGAAATAQAGKAAPPPKSGVFVAHEPMISANGEPAAYAIDGESYEHFVQYQRIGSSQTAHIVYYSKKLHAKTWFKHTAPGTWDISGHPRLEITLEPSNKLIYVIAYTCNGVYAVKLGDNAARLDQFTTVSTVSDCAASAGPLQMSSDWPDGATGQRLHIIVPDAATDGQWDLIAGTPSDTFAPAGTVPTADDFVPTQSAGNSYEGAVLVGHGVDSNGHKAIYEATVDDTYDPTTMTDHDVFSALTLLGSLGSATKDYIVDSVTRGKTLDVGLYESPGSRRGQMHSLFFDEQDNSLQWTTPIPVPHTGIHDRDLLLTTSPETGKLRATWERSIGSPASARTGKSGIITQRRVNNRWVENVVESQWWMDTLLSVTYDNTGLPHFFYLQQR